MGLDIIDKKIVGTIDNLKDKLEGKLPIDRLELLYLVNSWGRHYKFNISGVNDMQIEIEYCEPKECYDLSKIDTNKITNMDYIFKCSLFTGDISKWDVSNVSSMKEMFFSAKKFNQDISKWNTSNVISMEAMFYNSYNFNQDLNNWNVSNVTNINSIFSFAKKFNSPLNSWNVSNVTNMICMFQSALEFNQDISNWDVSNVTNMDFMFSRTKEFNQDISNWNLDKVDFCDYMFDNTEAFLDKYNSGKPLSSYTDKIKRWFNLNRYKMKAINIKEKYGEEVDIFFINVHSKNKDVLNELNKMDK